MSKKKIVKVIKLQILAGKANPAPPIGPALGSAGLNIMAFCKDFNEKTKAMGTDIIPVEITVYGDKTYTFIMKEPPVSDLIKKELKIESGSKVPNRDKVGKLTYQSARKIAEKKMKDMNANDVEAAIRIVLGTARSMGVEYDATVSAA